MNRWRSTATSLPGVAYSIAAMSAAPPPLQVLTLVFLSWAAGTLAFGLWTRSWGTIQSGHFKVLWPVTAALAIIAALCAFNADVELPGGWLPAASLLMGAVTNAMLLGHWHLNQPRMGNKPILRLVWGLWIGLVAFAITEAFIASSASGLAMLATSVALAVTAFALILNAFVHHLVRTRSIMSATGILYLQILLCFVAAFTGSLGVLSQGRM